MRANIVSKLLQCIGIVLVIHFSSLGQEKFKPKYLREDNKIMKDLTKNMTPGGWILFKDDAKITRANFFSELGKHLGLTKDFEMRRFRDMLDPQGYRHEVYQLYFKGIMVEGIEYTIDSKNEKVELSHGRIIDDLALDISKAMPEKNAFDETIKALKHDPKKYEKQRPQSELIISMGRSNDFTTPSFHLAYKYELSVTENEKTVSSDVYVDATSGKIFRKISRERECFNEVEGKNISLLNNNQHLPPPPQRL